MRKLLLINLLLLVPFSFVCGYEVPTTVQKKGILLEEFTGIKCGNCPQGHKIAAQLHEAKADCAYVIAVHSGIFADPNGAADLPDFRTEDGEALDVELGAYMAGYPCGTVNRHVFAGTSPIISRGDWIKTGKQIHAEDAPVNLWMDCSFNGETRELKVQVEGFYTAEVAEIEHFLNVVWTQNNIQGYQNGGGVGDEYMHQHMLRDYITEKWGDVIEGPKKGEYFTRQYTYILPEKIDAIDVKAEEIEVIAFVTADKREVLNVTGKKPSYTNFAKPLGVELLKPDMEMGLRYGYNYFETKLKNTSDQAITSAQFEVTINGVKQSVDWEGHISSFATSQVRIEVAPYDVTESNEYEIALTLINGEAFNSNTIDGRFDAPLKIASATVHITIQSDLFGDENVYMIKDREGTVVKQFGPYETDKKAVYEEQADLEPDEIYCLEVTDEWGDGIQKPKGYYKIYDNDKKLIDQNYDIKTYGARSFFQTSSATSISSTVGMDARVRLSFEPLSKTIALNFLPESSNKVTATIYSLTGSRIWGDCFSVVTGQSCSKQYSVDFLPVGIYLMNINTGSSIESIKFSVY